MHVLAKSDPSGLCGLAVRHLIVLPQPLGRPLTGVLVLLSLIQRVNIVGPCTVGVGRRRLLRATVPAAAGRCRTPARRLHHGRYSTAPEPSRFCLAGGQCVRSLSVCYSHRPEASAARIAGIPIAQIAPQPPVTIENIQLTHVAAEPSWLASNALKAECSDVAASTNWRRRQLCSCIATQIRSAQRARRSEFCLSLCLARLREAPWAECMSTVQRLRISKWRAQADCAAGGLV